MYDKRALISTLGTAHFSIEVFCAKQWGKIENDGRETGKQGLNRKREKRNKMRLLHSEKLNKQTAATLWSPDLRHIHCFVALRDDPDQLPSSHV